MLEGRRRESWSGERELRGLERELEERELEERELEERELEGMELEGERERERESVLRARKGRLIISCSIEGSRRDRVGLGFGQALRSCKGGGKEMEVDGQIKVDVKMNMESGRRAK